MNSIYNDNWNHVNIGSNNLQQHQRSASVVDYSDLYRPQHYSTNCNDGYQYSSFANINQTGKDGSKFSWHSPQSTSEEYGRNTHYSTTAVNNRPFESSFKTAISKMKETSLSRLGNVEKSFSRQPADGTDQFYYDRDSSIQQPFQSQSLNRSNTVLHALPNQYQSSATNNNSSVKIFRCNSVITSSSDPKPFGHNEPIYHNTQSVSSMDTKMIQQPPPLPTKKNFSTQSKQVDNSNDRSWTNHLTQTRSLDRKCNSTSSKSGTKIIIPIKKQSNSASQSPVPSGGILKTTHNPYHTTPPTPTLTPTTPPTPTNIIKGVNRVHEIPITKIQNTKVNQPKTIIRQDLNNEENDSDPNTDPLPTVQEIISRVEALNQQHSPSNYEKPPPSTTQYRSIIPNTTSSLQYTSNYQTGGSIKTPSASPTAYRSQKHDGVSFKVDSSVHQSKQYSPVSGSYAKTSGSPTKSKTISNLPGDFQKLHSAFLDQKKEILRLKNELEEKKQQIIQLEAQLKCYEPWRQ